MPNLPDPEFHATQMEKQRQEITTTFGGDRQAALNYKLGSMVAHAIAVGISMGATEEADRARRAIAASAKRSGEQS